MTLNADGTLTFQNDADLGAVNFTYSISDGDGGSDTATVTVTVDPVNDAPVAADDTGSVDADATTTISVLDNDTDVDGDLLTVTAASGDRLEHTRTCSVGGARASVSTLRPLNRLDGSRDPVSHGIVRKDLDAVGVVGGDDSGDSQYRHLPGWGTMGDTGGGAAHRLNPRPWGDSWPPNKNRVPRPNSTPPAKTRKSMPTLLKM